MKYNTFFRDVSLESLEPQYNRTNWQLAFQLSMAFTPLILFHPMALYKQSLDRRQLLEVSTHLILCYLMPIREHSSLMHMVLNLSAPPPCAILTDRFGIN